MFQAVFCRSKQFYGSQFIIYRGMVLGFKTFVVIIEGLRAKRAYIAFLANFHFLQDRANFLQDRNVSHPKRVRTIESSFASNRSQTESEKNNTEDEQCINQEETDVRIKRKRKNHEHSRKLGCKITHGCAMKRRQCSAIFVRNLRRHTPLHRQKGVQI